MGNAHRRSPINRYDSIEYSDVEFDFPTIGEVADSRDSLVGLVFSADTDDEGYTPDVTSFNWEERRWVIAGYHAFYSKAVFCVPIAENVEEYWAWPERCETAQGRDEGLGYFEDPEGQAHKWFAITRGRWIDVRYLRSKEVLETCEGLAECCNQWQRKDGVRVPDLDGSY